MVDLKELEEKVKKLEERFLEGVREKERMMESLGITAEWLESLEERLSPEQKKLFESEKAKLHAEIEAEFPEPGASSSPSRGMMKGIRV